jgi:hypothetical protein
MKMRHVIGLIATAVATSLNAQSNLILNGSFEAQSVPTSPGYITASVAFWSPVNGGSDLITAGYVGGSASDGLNFVDIIGNPGLVAYTGPYPTGISQDVSLDAGVTYHLTFDFNGDAANSPRSLAYSLGSLISGSVDVGSMNAFGGLGPVTPWQTVSVYVTPSTSGSYTLAFTTDQGAYGSPYLDNVSIAAVPEPTTLALVTAGGLLIFSFRRNK